MRRQNRNGGSRERKDGGRGRVSTASNRPRAGACFEANAPTRRDLARWATVGAASEMGRDGIDGG
ncbi:hypothetical protein C8Q76DRAFT_705198 [Earliella scabrosa]|nr:hypothetical protein C8Q76DRAFT_705198 [Earliella scabrosa]